MHLSHVCIEPKPTRPDTMQTYHDFVKRPLFGNRWQGATLAAAPRKGLARMFLYKIVHEY